MIPNRLVPTSHPSSLSADAQLPPTIMSKDKPAKMNGGSTGADAEVDLDSLDVKDRPRLKPPRTLETTLFDRLEKLYGDGIKRVLKVQYRSVSLAPNHARMH